MNCVDLRVEGAAGSAARFAPGHRREHVLDQWLITMHSPRLFVVGGQHVLGTQLTMVTVALDSLTDGGYPRPMGATHMVWLALLAAEFRIGYLDDGGEPRPYYGDLLGATEVAIPTPAAGRMFGRTLVSAIVHGDVTVGARNDRAAFRVAARTASRAAALITPITEMPPCPT